MMLSQSILAGVRVLRTEARRNIAIVAPALNKASDPIQQLFLDKVREYKQKSAGGKLVDSNPEIERELKNELERVAKQYGSDGKTDMLKFPEFKFPDVKIDPISQGAN
ncbi:ATP synthase-coupling factor 6, mitochondrial [Drosophila novamexicana]|uniref:ATP synthase-coupling factor 6, mitochondrial n=1 Tax=Drosophila novamexicana TaxID=47314 RepID=UPI0011E5B851|nr:ATP synthase-coupling factor 6, mitochondrial [Drosophila novamexicana]